RSGNPLQQRPYLMRPPGYQGPGVSAPEAKRPCTSAANTAAGPGPLPEESRLRTYAQGYLPTHARNAPCIPCASLCAARPGGGAAVTVAFTSFPGLPTSVAAARRFVTGVIRLYPWTTAPAAMLDEVIDQAELITSELATNAIRHTRSGDPGQTFTIRVSLDDWGVWTQISTLAPRVRCS